MCLQETAAQSYKTVALLIVLTFSVATVIIVGLSNKLVDRVMMVTLAGIMSLVSKE